MPAERRRCRCHGEQMDWTGRNWTCAVKRRARQLANYHAAPETKNYTRTRQALRSRIAQKREQIEQLEEALAQENPR